ncbi:type II secretion system F family protein [Planctomycetaceae bacterium]|nr:type II secretion system F family protein [bacterium]MDC0261816.1 type II secretion system F family protein [Planctomycetaceae bacterium]MDG2390172.1 type II secretion system F family protein [Planctomycetaceae bacterium]
MSDSASSTPKSLKADQFIALNEEITSLLRAGIPLSLGLHGFSSSVSGRLRVYSRALADEIDRGKLLHDALAAVDQKMPTTYQAILAAGAESGQLADAVESVAQYTRRAQETRNQITLAMIYPTLVVMLAWFLFWSSCLYILPRMRVVFAGFGMEGSGAIHFLSKLPREVTRLGWVPLVVMGAALAMSLYRVRSRGYRGALDYGWCRYLPGVARFVRYSHWSTFTHFASQLMTYGVPESRALTLAAQATGDPALMADANRWSDAAEQGKSPADELPAGRALPPFLVGMMRIGSRQNSLPSTLAHLSDMYSRKAALSSDRFQTIFPIVIVVAIAGTAVLLYALALFYPIIELMTNLA